MSAEHGRDENVAADVARLLPTPPRRDLPTSRNHALKELVMSEIEPIRDTAHNDAPHRKTCAERSCCPRLARSSRPRP
jgi:hypothetical protein